jgi:hypothetical protein
MLWRNMRRILLLVAFVAVNHLFAATVTSGFVRVTGTFVSGTFDVAGHDFVLTGIFSGPSNWPTALCPTCPFGETLPVDGYVLGNDFSSGSAVLMGVSFPDVIWGDLNAEKPSELAFSGPDIVITAPGLYTAPFESSGRLCGTLGDGPVPHPCAVDLPELTGQGIVTLRVEPGAEGTFFVPEATYNFDIPEPSTFYLAAAAPVLLLLARRRRRLPIRCGARPWERSTRRGVPERKPPRLLS